MLRGYYIYEKLPFCYEHSYSTGVLSEKTIYFRAGSNDRRDFTASELCAMVLKVDTNNLARLFFMAT